MILSGPDLFRAIQQSHDRLFFIMYTAAGTITPKLQLIQVNLDASARSSETHDYRTSSRYYSDFLTRVNSDTSKTFDLSRWRIIWHKYTSVDDTIEYSERRHEFAAGKVPNANEYISYADFIQLDDPSKYLLGPFDFADPGQTATGRSRGRERLNPSTWSALVTALDDRNIPLPPLSPSLLPDYSLAEPPAAKRTRTS